jgi:hypothetical protein
LGIGNKVSAHERMCLDDLASAFERPTAEQAKS